MTAKAGVGQAEARASEWSSQAALVGVVGAESPVAPLASEGSGAPSTLAPYLFPRDDPALGDGRAGAWMYTFQAADMDTLLHVVVDAREGVVSDLQVLRSAPVFLNVVDTPITSWDVDSDGAAEAGQGDSGWTDALGGTPLFVAYSLAQYNGSDRAIWSDQVWTDETTQAHVVVDAVDGGTLAVTDSKLFSDATFERGRQGGGMSYAADQKSAPLSVARPHDRFWVSVAWNPGVGLPVDELQVEVQDPDGAVAETFTVPAGSREERFIADAAEGSWQVVMNLGAVSSGGTYEAVWCVATAEYETWPCEAP